MPRADKLRAAGYERLPGSARHYRSPQGEIVSYRKAFQAVRGVSLEGASKHEGKFRSSYHLADQTRQAARLGNLSGHKLLTKTEEAKLAKMSLKDMIRGNYVLEKHNPRTGKFEAPKGPRSPRNRLFNKLANVLRSKDNSPNGKKAKYLIAIGRRRPQDTWDVGDTP